MLKLTFYNLSVELQTDDYILLAHINSFLQKHYTKHEQKGFSQNQATGDKLFGSKIKDRPIYMFHANQFIHLYHHLDKLGYKLTPDEKIDKRQYDIVPGDFKVRDGWSPYDYQEPIIEFLLDNPIKSKLVPIQTGKGKSQPLNAKIKVPGGWSTMGEMQIGTTVIAHDGTPTKVNGVYPQGKTPVFKITFIDGRTCEASDEHLWKVFIKDEKQENKKYQIVNTLRLKELTNRNTLVTYLDLIEPENSNDISLPIDPYLLGALLGDGGFTSGSIRITKYDKEFIDKIKTLIPDSMELVTQDNIRWNIVNKIKGLNKSFLITELKNLGLIGKYSHEKFIPDEYLFASYNQKLKLIQGLLDTDGSVNKNGSIIYGTSSYFLAKAVQYLIRSIGGIASITDSVPYYTYKGKKLQGKKSYRVFIRYKAPEKLLTLTRKLDRFKGYNKRAKNLKLRIESVEYIGEKETQCISIEHPDHLYVTDDFIVTHNTSTALFTISKLNYRLGIVILSQYVEKWVSDIVTIHEAKQSDVMVIQGSKALAALIELAKSDSLENNYYIFSSRTMQDYITQYEEDPQLCIDMYGCAPIDLFPLLGIGIMLVDETHQHFHAIFKIIIYTNVKFQIGLSATLMSDDSLVSRMHKVVYPNKCIYEGDKLDRYADVYAISYTIPEQFIRQIKTKNYGSNNYSHTAFEQSIIRNNDLLRRYIKLIKANIEDYYIEDYKDQDKVIIFVSTVALATRLADALRSFYPEFKVRRYCEEDSYEEMLGGDIIVSTPISAGTALDIPRLRVAVQTVSISSAPTNIQILGRLRKLTDRDVKFCYIYANNINKQRQYHEKRVELFRPRVANIAIRQSSCGL